MKILFTALTYYPETSGISIVTKYLAEGLISLGYDVSIVTTWKEGLKKEEEINKVKVYRFDIYDKKIRYAGEIDEYIQFVKNFDCDLIINEATQCVTTDVLLPILKEINAKKILHIHGFSGLTLNFFQNIGTIKNKIGNMYNYIRWKIYYSRFYNYLYSYDKILCLSPVDNGKAYVEKYTNLKPEIIENAAEDIFFKDNSNKKNILKKYLKDINKPYIISVANYVPVKNQEMILNMFYKSKIKNCSLVLIGKEKTYYYNKLIKLKKRLEKIYGKKDVNIFVNITRKDIPALISSSKAYIVSSLSEQYSISIIEAMASRVPFISTNVGNASILPGGIIIDSEIKMEKAIEKILINEDYRTSLAKDGYEYAYRNCRINKAVEKLNNYLKSFV